MESEKVIAMFQRVAKLVEPRHILAVHPDEPVPGLEDLARDYNVEVCRSVLCPRGTMYLLDRKQIEGIPETAFTVRRTRSTA